MSTETITHENCAVIITDQQGSVFANFYVNARHGMADADITALRWTGRTVAGARRWAHRQLKAHYA